MLSVEQNNYVSTPLWETCRSELKCFLGLMPLLQSDWTLPWCPHVTTSDASEDACGVCCSEWPISSVAAHARVPERSRFKKRSGVSARDSFFMRGGFVRDSTGLWVSEEDLDPGDPLVSSECDRDISFTEIDLPLLHRSRWQVVASRSWRRQENILILEARALLRSVQCLIWHNRAHNCRIVCLCDSMAVALSFERRRSRNFVLLALIRKLTAWCLVFNIKFYTRWIASESNVADLPSGRLFVSKRVWGPSSYQFTLPLSTCYHQKQDLKFGSIPGRSRVLSLDELLSDGTEEDSVLASHRPETRCSMAHGSCGTSLSHGAGTEAHPRKMYLAEHLETSKSDASSHSCSGGDAEPGPARPAQEPGEAGPSAPTPWSGESGACGPPGRPPAENAAADYTWDRQEYSDRESGTSEEDAPRLESQRALARTLTRRQARVAKADIGNLTFLEWSVVQSNPKYDQALDDFLKSPLVEKKPLRTDAEIDMSLVLFFNLQYLQGKEPHHGATLLSALAHRAPELGSVHGTRELPRAHRALKGWRRRVPPRSREPHVWPIWAAVIWDLCLRGFWRMGIYLLWLVTCYFRPGEPLKIRQGDLQKPVAGISRHWQINLFPEERPDRSKNYTSDEGVEMACQWCSVLPLTCAAVADGGPAEVVFPFTYPQFFGQLHVMNERLGLRLVPYEPDTRVPPSTRPRRLDSGWRSRRGDVGLPTRR